MAKRMKIPPTPRTRNMTIITVSLSDSFTVITKCRYKANAACSMQTYRSRINECYGESSMKIPRSTIENISRKKEEKNIIRRRL